MNDADRHLLTVFSAALERDRDGERSAYLDEACAGASDLRDRVEALLRAHGQAGPFLEPAGAAATVEPSGHPPAEPAGRTTLHDVPSEAAGATIGPYRLVQVIGEGGMGTVYLAEQTAPVRRVVALKIIKPGMDTGQVVARFEAERQALAMMDHPSIAKVLDAGSTAAGRPFFVMELVKGVPITEYCDTVHLTPKERLELFIPVCEAVQHAHQKGIIHRDLKPSNVLVAMQDGRPVPKVIDFGIAKATEQKLSERSLFTQHGAVVGTLEYMSPEQAEMSAMGVDTRTDVYALGVMLYELLTGSTPLDRARLRQAAYVEILKRIREEEPPKPSTRLSESGESLPSVAALRRTEPSRLTKLVRGDLDWIVMKAIEKDRVRRYETANGFARDIRRHLDGDPVEACPPSARYRLGKFARKHLTALVAAGAFAALLVAATTISAGLAVWANRERVRAENAESSARAQQGRAQEREGMAVDAVKRFRDAVTEEPELKNSPSLHNLRKRLLKEPLNFFRTLRDRLKDDRDTRPESLARLAQAHFDLARLTEEIGDTRDALATYRESVAIWERLARDHPAVAELRNQWSGSLNNIGELQRAMGKPTEALASQKQALAILEVLASENPSVAEYQQRLSGSYNNVGILQQSTGHPAEALESYGRALAIQERLVREHPTQVMSWRSLGITHHNIGIVRHDAGDLTEALASYKKGREIRERLARERPGDTRFQEDLAGSDHSIGLIQNALGQHKEALETYERAIVILERLTRENPAVTSFQASLAATLGNRGGLQQDMGKRAEALASRERAHQISERLARENLGVAQFQRDLAIGYGAIGELKKAAGRRADAMDAFMRSHEIWDRLARDSPLVTEFRRGLAHSHRAIGLLQAEMDRPAEALTSLEKAHVLGERLVSEEPAFVRFRASLASIYGDLGALQGAMDRAKEARASYDRAVEISERLAREQPDSADFASSLGGVLNNRAMIDLRARRFAEAKAGFEQSILWQRKALAVNRRNPVYRQFLGNHLRNLIDADVGLGRIDEADEARRQLADLIESDPANEDLDARLAEVLKGRVPRDNAERLHLAFRANRKGLHTASVRLWVEALAADPRLGDDRQGQHRYNAACAAALAASGRGKAEPTPDGAAKAKFRGQALDWLGAELSAWRQVARTLDPGNKKLVAAVLRHWKADSDLVGLRDPANLNELTEGERTAFRRLWDDVDRLLSEAEGR